MWRREQLEKVQPSCLNVGCLAERSSSSAIQPTFKYGGSIWFNYSLLHKLLITGQGEQVVSRRGELNRDLLSSTCEFVGVSKVRCRIGVK